MASKWIRTWLIATIAISVIAWLDGGTLAGWLALEPARVWHGQIWRLVTWPWVQGGPMSLVCTCAVIYALGGALASVWGDRRLRRFVIEIVLVAAIATCVVAAITRGWHVWRLGGVTISSVLVIAWARQFPHRPLRLYYGLLVLNGRRLVQLTVGVAALCAIYFGLAALPELVACVAAALYPRSLLRR